MTSKSRNRRPASLEGAFAAPPTPKRGEGLATFLQRQARPDAQKPATEPPVPIERPATAVPAASDVESRTSSLATTEQVSDEVTGDSDVHARLIADGLTTATITEPHSAGSSIAQTVRSNAAVDTVAAETSDTIKTSPEPDDALNDTDTPIEAQADESIENMPVYLDAPTLKALKAEKGRIGGTYADVAEEALEERIDEVALILRQPSKPVGTVPRRRKKQKVRGGIQVQLRFSKEQRDWLDRKKDELGAPNRSIVVALALQLKLGTLPDSSTR